MKMIPLTQGKAALVDDEDFERLSAFKWKAVKGNRKQHSWYAEYSAHNGTPFMSMHRFLMGLGNGRIDKREVDHIDGDGLNNTKANLRIATRSQNARHLPRPLKNKSGFRGVRRNCRQWDAMITINAKPTFLGSFDTPEKAARAYDEAARRHAGEFAVTNADLGLLSEERV